MSVERLLDSLFRKHKKELTYYADQRSENVADDLVQECFLQLLSHPDPYSINNHRAYLYRITNNLLNLHYRKQGIHAKYLEDYEDIESVQATTTDLELSVYHQQILSKCLQALLELTPLQRSIFFLHRIDGRSYPEIAKMFSISKATVERHFVVAMTVCVSVSLAHADAMKSS